MEHRAIDISISTSEEYSRHAIVVMASLLDNVSESAYVRFHILDSEISEPTKKKFFEIKTKKKYSVDFLKVDKNLFRGCPNSKNITLQTYYKVALSSLLPQADKVLYLDCDIIVSGDVSPLFEIDLDNYYLAAAPDCNEEFFVRRDNMPKNSFVFNGGVILFNLKKWREDNIEDLVFRIMRLNPKFAGFLTHFDQSLLGKLLGDKTKILDLRWNLQYLKPFFFDSYYFSRRREFRRAAKNPAIIHFVSWAKPWFAGKNMFNPYWKLYVKYLHLTPFAFKTAEEEQKWISKCKMEYRKMRNALLLKIIFRRPYVILKRGFWQNILTRIIP